MLNVNMK